MLSVAKLSPGQGRYYERSVADGLDDYYAGRGDSPGVWVGRAARELELEGGVREGAGTRRGTEPEGLPARRRLPLRGAPAGRVVTLARGRVGDPAERVGGD